MKYYIAIAFSFQFLCVFADGETYWTDDPSANRVEFDTHEEAEDFSDTIGVIAGKVLCVVQSEPTD